MLHMLIYFSAIVCILLCTAVLFVTNCGAISKWSFSILFSLLQTELFLCCFVLFNKRLFSPYSFITTGIEWYRNCQWICSAKLIWTLEFLNLGAESQKFEFTQTIQEQLVQKGFFFHLPRVILISFCHCMWFINLFINMIVKLFREMYFW